ncbi:MEKHLA protein [Dillenia turbinata]|uniref:MEKHLA protein n=1 Tax=Dillenia turbinata TaxID=194707 RepID=A0AAN8VPF6_9MAGN
MAIAQNRDFCSQKGLQSLPVLIFGNQAGLEMLESTLVALQDITLDKIFEESSHVTLFSSIPNIMQQGFAHLPGGLCMSTKGHYVSYDQAIAWKGPAIAICVMTVASPSHSFTKLESCVSDMICGIDGTCLHLLQKIALYSVVFTYLCSKTLTEHPSFTYA